MKFILFLLCFGICFNFTFASNFEGADKTYFKQNIADKDPLQEIVNVAKIIKNETLKLETRSSCAKANIKDYDIFLGNYEENRYQACIHNQTSCQKIDCKLAMQVIDHLAFVKIKTAYEKGACKNDIENIQLLITNSSIENPDLLQLINETITKNNKQIPMYDRYANENEINQNRVIEEGCKELETNMKLSFDTYEKFKKTLQEINKLQWKIRRYRVEDYKNDEEIPDFNEIETIESIKDYESIAHSFLDPSSPLGEKNDTPEKLKYEDIDFLLKKSTHENLLKNKEKNDNDSYFDAINRGSHIENIDRDILDNRIFYANKYSKKRFESTYHLTKEMETKNILIKTIFKNLNKFNSAFENVLSRQCINI